jgi:hypothetical protein
MTIKINDRDVKLRYTFRAILLYENITGKSFNPTTTTDTLIFMYSVIMASEKDLIFTFDQFMDMIDENPRLVIEFSEMIAAEFDKNDTLYPVSEEEEKKSKAPAKKKK